jgi:hypothetical protein
MENDALPPEGTFSRLMSMDRQPAKPAESQPAGQPAPPHDLPEDRSLERSNVPDKKTTNVVSKQPTKKGSNVVAKQPTNQRSNEDGVYAISVPTARRMLRASFDIFYDQKIALDKLKLAAVDAGEPRPRLNTMVQEAIDLYIQRRVRQLPHVRLRRETADDT